MNASALQRSPLLGAVIDGKYRLEAELGSGGMGTVYRATQLNVDRPVAIKLLHAELSRDAGVRKRFETEARAIARLSHPNCVTLHDFGFSTGLNALFIVVEFLSGEALFKYVARPMELRRAVAIMRQVAVAIEHAHSHKIVHRDLKPENVMLVPTGRDEELVKVLDFGIARLMEEGSCEEGEVRLTRAGQIFGTPQYMSPEQGRARLDITHSTDIYSMGVMLYELLEGRLPFTGDAALDIVLKHVTDPVPPMTRPGVPEELKAVVLRCLQKEPAARFADCSALIEALDAVKLPEAVPQEEEFDPEAPTLSMPPLNRSHLAPAALVVDSDELLESEAPTELDVGATGPVEPQERGERVASLTTESTTAPRIPWIPLAAVAIAATVLFVLLLVVVSDSKEALLDGEDQVFVEPELVEPQPEAPPADEMDFGEEPFADDYEVATEEREIDEPEAVAEEPRVQQPATVRRQPVRPAPQEAGQDARQERPRQAAGDDERQPAQPERLDFPLVQPERQAPERLDLLE